MVRIGVRVFVVLRDVLELLLAQVAIEGFQYTGDLGLDSRALCDIFLR